MKLELLIDKGIFIIQVANEPDKKLCEASLSDLKDIKEEDGIIYADWIYHLSRKAWISSDILYELAVVIKKEHPEIDFNWYHTFYDTEKYFYQENIKKLDINNTTSSESLFDSILKGLKVSRKDTLSKDAENHLEELVNKRIKDYKL